MHIESRIESGFTVITVDGRLDTVAALDFDEYCQRIIDGEQHKVVFDLAELEFISSSGLRVILATTKRLRPQGGGVAICGVTGVVKEALLISGFSSFMPVVEDLSAAYNSL